MHSGAPELAVCLLALWMPPTPWRQWIQSAMHPAGSSAALTEHLFWIFFAFCLTAFVLVMIYLGGAMSGHGRQIQPAPPAPPHANPEGDRKARAAVIAAIIATTATLFGLLTGSVFASRRNQLPDAPNPVTIQLIGHQWWWEVRYMNPDKSLVVTTANEIHVPAATPIHMLLTSADVIHSFWVPSIRGKRDLLPGYQTDIWFSVKAPGVFRGQCAEFCGAQHAHMGFFLVAQPETDFQSWLHHQAQPAAPPATPEEQAGEQVFLSHPCVTCHAIRGTNANSHFGPDLTHLASRETIAAGILLNTPGNLGGWIEDPQRIKPGDKMPQNNLPPADLTSLLAYLDSLK